MSSGHYYTYIPVYDKNRVESYIKADDNRFSKCDDIDTDLENTVFFVYELYDIQQQETYQTKVKDTFEIIEETLGAAEFYYNTRKLTKIPSPLEYYVIKRALYKNLVSTPIDNIAHALTDRLDLNNNLGDIVESITFGANQHFYPCFHLRFQCINCKGILRQKSTITRIYVNDITEVQQHIEKQMKTLMAGRLRCSQCHVQNDPSTVLCSYLSLPSTLMVKISRVNLSQTFKLNLTNLRRNLHPTSEAHYAPICVIHDNSIKWHQNKTAVTEDNVFVLFNLEQTVMHPTEIKFKDDELNQGSPLKFIKDVTISDELRHHLEPLDVTKLIHKEGISNFTIRAYFQLLVKENPNVAHLVTWFDDHFFYNFKPDQPKTYIYHIEPRGKVSTLFDMKHIILIPVNVENNHWILLILDIVRKRIYYFDSFGHVYDSILCQMWRYLEFQHLLKYGSKNTAMMKPQWKIVFCHEMDNFPLQGDGTSCGVRCCMMAKAYVTGQRFNWNQDNAWNTMLHEIATQKLV